LGFIKTALEICSRTPLLISLGLVAKISSPIKITLSPISLFSFFQPFQSFSSKGSSKEIIGYSAISFL